jgi:hypothetical protein
LQKSEPGYQFQIQKARSQPVRHCKNRIREILYQEVRNRIIPVNQIKHFQGSPDVFKVSEGVMTSPITFFAIQQQRAESNIDPNIWVDNQ